MNIYKKAVTLIFLFWGVASLVHAETQKPLINLPQDTLTFLKQQPHQYAIKPAFQKRLVRNYLKHYYAPWHKPLKNFPPLDLFYIERSVIKNYQLNPGWNENSRLHPQRWADDLAKNMDLSTFPNHQANAISTNLTNLRLLPTLVPSFGNPKQAGQGYPFDNLQISMLDPNQPIHIIQTTKDGAWNFVLTPSSAMGWVKTKDLAIVSQKFIKQWQRKQYDYVTPIQAHHPLKGKHAEYYFSTRIGELYPLVKRYDQYDDVLVAARNVDGQAVIRTVKIPKKIVRRWPLPLTSENIARLANHFLGAPYGWGGLYGYRDCSATTRDLFGPFAIWLPRHSTEQASTGIMIGLVGKSSEEKKALILKRGIPFFTLLWLHGHVLLYIGQSNHQLMAFHAPWGIHTKNAHHKLGRIVIGRAVITPLNLGHGHLNIPETWLDQIQSFTYLVPPGELIPSKLTAHKNTTSYFCVLKKIQKLPVNAKAISPLTAEKTRQFLRQLKQAGISSDYQLNKNNKLVSKYGEKANLYKGDFNNDGREEYVFISTGGTMHTNTVTAVYQRKKGKLVSIDFPDSGKGPNFHLWIAKPFAYTKNQTTYLRFMDYPGTHTDYDPLKLSVYTYLWKGASFKQTAKVSGKHYLPCRLSMLSW